MKSALRILSIILLITSVVAQSGVVRRCCAEGQLLALEGGRCEGGGQGGARNISVVTKVRRVGGVGVGGRVRRGTYVATKIRRVDNCTWLSCYKH